jgi:pimeloyl-ACP methyl ester carboxylesterase
MAIQPDITLRSPYGTPYREPLSTKRFMYERRWRIILVHGFRNSERDALESYGVFHSNLSALSALFARHLFYLVWPGDVLRKLKPHRYFVDNVRNAREAGKILAKFLNEIITDEAEAESDCEFIIVAHSLGCWLTAEMMAELHRLDPSVCRNFKLILMAGALPTVDVENHQLYGAGLASALHVSNLYSSDDTVLRDRFPVGLIPDRGTGLEAIGLNGKPISFGWSQREQMKKFGHSDYWPKPASAEFLARLLGVPVPVTLPAYDIASYYPPEYRPASTDDESP